MLDILTTLIGFSLGNTEASPFVRLMVHWGPFTGLVMSKIVAVGIAFTCLLLHRRKLILCGWLLGPRRWSPGPSMRALQGSKISEAPTCYEQSFVGIFWCLASNRSRGTAPSGLRVSLPVK